jgi:hypothetical protein
MSLELGGWLVGSFGGALMAQRLGASLSSFSAVVFGLALFAVNGLYDLSDPLPLLFWVTGTLACVAGSVAGACMRPPKPAVVEKSAGPEREHGNARGTQQEVAALLAASLSKRSFLQRTGQAGKYSAGNALALTGAGLMLAGWFLLSGYRASVTSAVGAGVGMVGLAFQCLAIRCPRCRAKVVWEALSTRPHGVASYWAELQQVCPKCGYDPPE